MLVQNQQYVLATWLCFALRINVEKSTPGRVEKIPDCSCFCLRVSGVHISCFRGDRGGSARIATDRWRDQTAVENSMCSRMNFKMNTVFDEFLQNVTEYSDVNIANPIRTSTILDLTMIETRKSTSLSQDSFSFADVYYRVIIRTLHTM